MYRLLVLCMVFMVSQSARADIGVAVGINLTYDFRVGVTVKALSSDKRDRRVLAVGTTYYPLAAKKVGFDVGVGVADFNIVGLIGIDILQDASYMSVGYEDMSRK